MADRHRVYLPGPLGLGLPEVIDHAPGCDPETCPVLDALAEWLAESEEHRFPVQGDYFTADGRSFERCAWQPDHRLRRRIREGR